MPTQDQPERSDLFQPGQSFGRFYLVQLIGEGGTSRIFKALQQPINRLVALKIPSFADAGRILTPDEFLSEATLMARLEHANVVRIYDFGVQGDKAFICMEYVEGWNLQELAGRGPLSAAAALAAGLQTLEGLMHAHAQGVLHLDLSPANVLIAKNGVAKLSDFGMAGKKPEGSGRIVGTPAFLSPEHVAGKAGTPRSDLFSFASLLYFAAAGAPLFDPGEGNTQVTQALDEIARARERPPEARIRKLPPALAKPILTALQGEDAEKLQRELREAWKKIAGEEKPEAVLRRENGDWDRPDADAFGGEPDGSDLRERYLSLRSEGRHREAVALLERALRRHPDNPLLRELLSMPPAKAKAAAATVEVAAAKTGGANGAGGAGGTAASGPSHARRRAPLRAALAAMGILAVTLMLAMRARESSGGPNSGRSDATGPVAGVQEPSHPPVRTSASPQEEKPADLPAGETAKPVVPARKPKSPRLIAASFIKPVARGVAHGRGPGEDGAQGVDRSGAAPGTATTAAVAIAGPKGTRLSVDDTAQWTSPSPEGGWPVAPGLVNLTLTPPGSRRPITSSLFLSADTLYVLNLEAGGGFSVLRKRR